MWANRSRTCLSKFRRIDLQFETFAGNTSLRKNHWAEHIEFCTVLPNHLNFRQEYPNEKQLGRQPSLRYMMQWWWNLRNRTRQIWLFEKMSIKRFKSEIYPKSHQVAATNRPDRFLGASPPPFLGTTFKRNNSLRNIFENDLRIIHFYLWS